MPHFTHLFYYYYWQNTQQTKIIFFYSLVDKEQLRPFVTVEYFPHVANAFKNRRLSKDNSCQKSTLVKSYVDSKVEYNVSKYVCEIIKSEENGSFFFFLFERFFKNKILLLLLLLLINLKLLNRFSYFLLNKNVKKNHHHFFSLQSHHCISSLYFTWNNIYIIFYNVYFIIYIRTFSFFLNLRLSKNVITQIVVTNYVTIVINCNIHETNLKLFGINR